MKDKYVLTAESVTEGHPDKLCDTIADAVVDACLEHDPACLLYTSPSPRDMRRSRMPSSA